MADRKVELERKKQKLEQMKAERKRAEEERMARQREEGSGAGARPTTSDLRQDVNSLLEGLIPAETKGDGVQLSRRPDAAVGTPAGSEVGSTGDESGNATRKVATLSVSKVTQTNIPPRETVTYSKETQTPKEVQEKEDEDGDSLEVTVDTPPVTGGGHKLPHTAMHQPADSTEEEKQPVAPPPPRELSEEERRKILMSEDFNFFFSRAARVVERALFETVDIFTDYSGADDGEEDRALIEGQQLKLNRIFYDEHWSKHRTVTSLDWSTQFPELLLASYNNNDEAPNEPDGVVLVWSSKYKKTTPEFIFHCQSPVTSACFAKFHPNLIIGGTYSGQIVVWDNRSNKRTPVQRTPLSAVVHTHPVYCISVVGTQNAHNLASVSTDGKMCYWSLDMLSQPQDSMELQWKQSKPVAALCCAFPSGDFNNFVVGAEDCSVYSGCRHGNKAGVNDLFEGHQGPVTGIDCHAVPGQIDFSPYFITSSFDWTVKLWNSKEMKPLHSFEDYSDYVFDCKWSPIHPALFSTVDGSGRLDLWNLNIDTEVPTATAYVENNAAVNRCRWHQAGHVIAAGDDSGKIHLYDVGEPLAVPRNDDWTKFVHTLQELKLEQADQEEEEQASLSQSPMR